MKRAFAAGLVLVVVGTAGCKTIVEKIKAVRGGEAEDASAVTAAEPSSSAPPTPAPEPLATNEADVKRFADESRLPAPEDDDLDRAATARTEPSATAKAVAALAKGDKVTLHAEKNGFFLVTFPDPKDRTKRLMGWVPQLAFVPPATITGTKVTCPTGQGIYLTKAMKGPLSSKQIVDLVGAGDALCAKACVADKDCAAPMTCVMGGGFAVSGPGNVATKAGSICMKKHAAMPSTNADAGATTPTDAGPVASTDAAAAHAPDAATVPAEPPPSTAPEAGAPPPAARDAGMRERIRAIPGLR
jgi:hypothetical protein